jgi:flagellar biosynthesis/type III secretory pathway protein FliH
MSLKFSVIMPERFVPLAQWLVPAAPPHATEREPATAAQEPLESKCAPDVDALLREARRFRATLAEAVETSCGFLLREIAVDVVGRELELRDADVTAIIARACERYSIDAPIVVRVNPSDADAVRLAYPVVIDTDLRCGDAIVEVSSGAVDARLGVRLDRVLKTLA